MNQKNWSFFWLEAFNGKAWKEKRKKREERKEKKRKKRGKKKGKEKKKKKRVWAVGGQQREQWKKLVQLKVRLKGAQCGKG